MACLDDNALFELSTGQLPAGVLDAAEQHVDGCARCRRLLAETLRTSAPRPARPPPVLTQGTAVGRYLVIERVGAGAMGQVFSAYDPLLDRRVALKLLRPGSSSEEHRARLSREAQTLARLSHPNVVTVFDVGTWEEQLFMTLEFVSGGSVRTWLAARPATGWREVLALYVQAARGLAAAHDAGVVHRDFKPDNVLVRADGRVQVTDFGLAAASEGSSPALDDGELSLTRSDTLLGTPAYMAADQLEGAAATFASDQFSFCVALFEALTGERPFEGRTVGELQAAIRAGQVRPLKGEVPPAVRRVLLRGLSADPRARFPSMTALADALEATRSRPRMVLALVATVVLLGVAGPLISSGRSVQRQPACELAERRQLETWSPSRRAALAASFEATGLSYAKNTFAWLDGALAARAGTWSSQRTEACEAVLSGSAVFRAQLQCLDEHWAELEATVRVLETSGAEGLRSAVKVVERLPSAAACTQPSVLARYGADAGPCEACVADQAVVAQARALFEAGQFPEATGVTALALDGGVTTPAAIAALEFERARLLEEAGKLDDAEAAFFQAGLGAQRAGDAFLGAASFAELGFLVGYLRSRADDGTRWVAQGEALAALHHEARLDERFASVRGVIAARRGQLPEAERYFAEAERLTRELRGEAHPMRARALSNLGNAQLHQGRVKEALPKLEAAWKLLAAALGEEHPDAFQALNSYGAALGTAEDYAAAVPLFERALAGYRKTLGADHPRIGTAALNLAEAQRRLNQLEAALASFIIAEEVWKKTDAADLSIALAGHGEVLLELGRVAEAVETTSRAVAVCERQACEPIDEGLARFLHARAMRGARRPEKDVIAEAKRAVGLLVPLGEGAAEQVEQLRAFLAEGL
jgi:eukaryotic-like serine/threonine-protein kinase